MCASVTGVQACALPICPGGERVGSGTGALRTSDIGGARFRAGFQPMRGDRRERKAMLCQCQKRRCGKRGGSQRLRTATFAASRSEEHTSELQSLMRISYAVFCLKKKNTINIRS